MICKEDLTLYKSIVDAIDSGFKKATEEGQQPKMTKFPDNPIFNFNGSAHEGKKKDFHVARGAGGGCCC